MKISGIIAGLFLIGNACCYSHHKPISGLNIENHPNRGLNYTDPQGTKYSYRYIPITITNDTTTAIHIQIALSKEYDYPANYGDQVFKVFLLPKELKSDMVTYDTVTYEIGNNEIRDFFDKGLDPPYVLDEILEPGEKCEITRGILYPRPTNCGFVPNALFLQGDEDNFEACDNQMNHDKSTPKIPIEIGELL